MLPFPIGGGILITLTLLLYGLGTVTVQRFKIVTRAILWFYMISSIMHISAYVIIASYRPDMKVEYHGIMSFISMFVLFTDTFNVWRFYFKHGRNSFFTKRILTFSKIAYAYWVFTYFVASIKLLFLV